MKQKRYETAQSIEAEIDKINEAKRNNLLEYAELGVKIAKLRNKMASSPPNAASNAASNYEYQIEHLLKEQDVVDKRRPLLENKLRRLAATHAAFLTVDMFGVQETVLQK